MGKRDLAAKILEMNEDIQKQREEDLAKFNNKINNLQNQINSLMRVKRHNCNSIELLIPNRKKE